ncbi:MAG: ABC transporter ATP-binding protein, partial [Gemmatimonadota bacterium]|nr:ABC transporter ATP-binding protein [Gemmatimonadota bacterium]
TVARCLAGFDDPDEGRIDAGGGPPIEGSIQYVPSYPLFFNATLRENLTVAREGTVSEEEIHRALSTACVDGTIRELPDGLDTILEEDLRPLSKGQLQRVAIARALLLEPAILVLDESLSGVEAELEDRILERVRSRHPDTILIVVSHRENVEEIATTAITMEAGRDAEETHEREVRT